MLALKLAYLNLKRAGLRTWLNVIVLSLSYVLIIWSQGLYDGMNEQISRVRIDEELGGGQYWHKDYDPYDPLSLDDSHAPPSPEISALINNKSAARVLVRQAVIYPEGRIQSVLLKGIDPSQTVVSMPSSALAVDDDTLPLLIGSKMSRDTGLNEGDFITMRWRDKRGTFDAIDGKIVKVMTTDVQTIDNGQLWMPIDRLEEMTALAGEATYVIVKKESAGLGDTGDFLFKDHEFLLKDIREMVKAKKVGGIFMYLILMFLAMLAIFDTQVLSVFRRKKEIGTLIALGMTRKKVVALFTIEGAMHGILALLLACTYGLPLFAYTRKYGFPLPEATESFGYAFSDRLFPVYGGGMVVATVIIIMITVTIVSYLPSSKIAHLKPTDALKGKLS